MESNIPRRKGRRARGENGRKTEAGGAGRMQTGREDGERSGGLGEEEQQQKQNHLIHLALGWERSNGHAQQVGTTGIRCGR
jgi:hypothetical protein